MDSQLSMMSEGALFGQNSPEMEELVLAAFVNFPDSYYQFSDQVSINEFSIVEHKYIYMAIKEVSIVSKIDIATVTDRIIQKKYEGNVGSKDGYSLVKYLGSICERVDDDSHLKEHIKLLNEYAKRRALLTMSKNITEQCNEMVSPDDVVSNVTKSVVDIQSMGEVEEFDRKKKLTGLIERIKRKEIPPMITSGINSLDEFMTGWSYGNLVILAASAGLGKFQSVHSKIMTPKGWSTMGSMKIGDIVSTPDGKSDEIINVFPQGIKKLYRITKGS